jgi:endonuclease G
MRLIGLLLLLLLTVAPGVWANTCDCDIPPEQVTLYDTLLILNPEQQSTAIVTHLPWGVPIASEFATGEHLLIQTDYILDYDNDLQVPLWAAYRLTAADIDAKRNRTECFRPDPRLAQEAAADCADYDEPIFDRGHLVPNADMTRSEAAMINTYLFSNMTPQYANFNRIIWSRLEGLVRDWAKTRGAIYVISGTIFDRDNDDWRDLDEAAEFVAPTLRVAIPTAFYKIIVAPTANSLDSITLLLPHATEKHTGREGLNYLETHITSIDRIETLTGVDFFPEFDEQSEEQLEATIAPQLWRRGNFVQQ